MFGTVILWVLAVVGVIALLLWGYVYFSSPKKIKKMTKEAKKEVDIKKKRKKKPVNS